MAIINQSLDSCSPDGVATLQCIPIVLQNLLVWLFGLVGLVAVILVAYGGIKFILSGGDPKQVDSARKTITFALLGLVVVVSSFVIINLVATITGVSCIRGLNIGSCK